MVDVDYIPSPPRAECDNAKILDRLDAATLKAIEARRSILNEPRNTSTAGSSLIPVKNKSGPKSIQSNRSRRSKLSSFPEKRRGKQALERDETESVISSVSTHRSTKSTGIAAVSWFGSPREEKPDEDRKLGVTITAENLAILNKMNHGDTMLRDILITRPSRRPSRQQKSPDDKNIIVSNDANWWPALF